MQSSTAFFRLATPVLWSAQVSLDIFKGLTVIGNHNQRSMIDINEDALTQLEMANERGEELRAGSLPWRWRKYLRSVRSIELDLSSSYNDAGNGRKFEASALGPHLPATFDAVHISMEYRANVTEESLVRHRAWTEWLLDRRSRDIIAKHLILGEMTVAEMDPFLQLRMKKLTWLRDSDAPDDIGSALGKIDDLETLVLGKSYGALFDITELYKITDVAKRFGAFQSLCLNVGYLPSKIDKAFPPKLTQFSGHVRSGDMKALGDILKASRSQMKEFRVGYTDLKRVQDTAFWGILSTMTSLTKLELIIPNLNIMGLPSTISKLTNLQEVMFHLGSGSVNLGDDVVCLPRLRHLEVKGSRKEPTNIIVNFGFGLKTISIKYAVLAFDHKKLSIKGMPHLEELTLVDASITSCTPFAYDVGLAEMLEDPAASPSLARVKGMTILRLKHHVNDLKYGPDG
ncbi:hypothetical protein HK101_010932 [Irineochytrium annulatum]|nr:hypothetical protein HK101_010932 [Irineochytrium annulatum]